MAGQTVENALKLDVNAQKNFIKFFKAMGEKPATTVRFFDRGDYYTVHGENDTVLLSEIIFKSLNSIKIMNPTGDEELAYLCVNKTRFEIAVKELLLVKNYRVEVFTNKKGTGPNDWKLDYKGSPGNLVQFEDILFSNSDMILGTAVIAVHVKMIESQMVVGLSCVEANDHLIQITEFADNEFFSELEATTILLSPKECLLTDAGREFRMLQTVMERNGVLVTIRKKGEFSMQKSDLIQDLNKLLSFKKGQQKDANTLPELGKDTAISALGALVNYLGLANDESYFGNFELKPLTLNRFVHLDGAAVSALNILPKAGISPNSPAYRLQSILGVLDRCRTPQGHRLMANWVKQPLRNEASLKDRHDIVQCLLDSPGGLTDLHDVILKRIPDVLMLTNKLMRKKANLCDLCRLYQVIVRTPKLVTALLDLENSTVKSVLCDSLMDTLTDLKMLKQMVEQVIDFEGLNKGEYFVTPSFDEQLQESKGKMDEILNKMDKVFTKAADDLELDKGSNLKLEFVSHLGYHFRVSLKDDAVLRKSSKYIILDAIKGGVRFTTEKLKSYDEDFKDIKEQYEEQQNSIVQEIMRVAVGYLGPLTCLNNQIAQIDCLVSFAIAASSAPIPYVRPKILPEGSGVLQLKSVRHPCLELQEGVTYISNDVLFKKDETEMYIITGPNMGGKSTYIRSVGTAVLMALVGAFVPCEEATISMVDSILGRIGATDNIMKGFSTFMVEMVEASAIVRIATEKSIVIIDELGRGTSTYEGCGMAWAIAEQLVRVTKCFTLFATHFHEITELSKEVPTAKNYHMDALTDDSSFLLLYKLKPGETNKSFGIEIAKLANFPPNTVKMAQIMFEEFLGLHDNSQLTEDEATRRIDEAIPNCTPDRIQLMNELCTLIKN